MVETREISFFFFTKMVFSNGILPKRPRFLRLRKFSAHRGRSYAY